MESGEYISGHVKTFCSMVDTSLCRLKIGKFFSETLHSRFLAFAKGWDFYSFVQGQVYA